MVKSLQLLLQELQYSTIVWSEAEKQKSIVAYCTLYCILVLTWCVHVVCSLLCYRNVVCVCCHWCQRHVSCECYCYVILVLNFSTLFFFIWLGVLLQKRSVEFLCIFQLFHTLFSFVQHYSFNYVHMLSFIRCLPLFCWRAKTFICCYSSSPGFPYCLGWVY